MGAMSVVNLSKSQSTGRIQRLPEQLANQIAAGEVVERPASVIKELMENALDAGASSIEVEVEKGGMRMMRIRDNGRGIHVDDLPLAIQRHATSKIHSLEHLQNVQSMGFRGEALASIGSVSRLKLSSRTADSEFAWCVEAEGSEQAGSAIPTAFTIGTLVEVADLFYNTPARRRFLRTEQTEYRHLEEVFKRIALSRMDVAMKLKHNQRIVYQLPAASDRPAQEKRIARLCGRGFMQQARYLEFEHGVYHLHGWLGNPGYSRSQGDIQYGFINQRAIKDKLVNHAIRQACADFIEDGRYPAFALYLELPVTEVDVNVHPSKHEVRFHESRMVHDFLVATLRRALMVETGQGNESTAPSSPPPHSPAQGDYGERPTSVLSAAETQVSDYQDGSLELLLLPGNVAWFQHQGQDYLCNLNHVFQAYYLQQLQQAEKRSRPLLIPQRVTVASGNVDGLLHCLQQYQLEAGQVAPDALMIRAIPEYLQALNLHQFCTLLGQQSPCPDASLLAAIATKATDYEHESISKIIHKRFVEHTRLAPGQQRQFFIPLTGQELRSLFNNRGGE